MKMLYYVLTVLSSFVGIHNLDFSKGAAALRSPWLLIVGTRFEEHICSRLFFSPSSTHLTVYSERHVDQA